MERDFNYFVEVYGIAGAREKFENVIASALQRLHSNKAYQVEVSKGDGGIDIFCEGLDKPIIYQCKFFLKEISSSQKNQIRESFRTAAKNYPEFKEWVLCIPKLLTESEHKWFCKFKDNNPLYKITLFDKTALLNLLKDTDEYNSVFNLISIEKSVIIPQARSKATLLNLAFFGIQFSYLIGLLLGDRKETASYCEILQNGLLWVSNPQTKERINAVREFVLMVH